MKLKYSNHVAFNHFHGSAVNNLGAFVIWECFVDSIEKNDVRKNEVYEEKKHV